VFVGDPSMGNMEPFDGYKKWRCSARGMWRRLFGGSPLLERRANTLGGFGP
jgi:hypothetical protein